MPQPELLGKISWSDIFTYFWRDRSLFRQYQDLLLQRFGSEFSGRVTEIGCELHYQHQRHFPNADEYHCTNVGRDYSEYLDVTNMDTLEDNSQDGLICISVLEHVFNFEAALKEMERTLKPGGKLLLALPYAFSLHDDVDYWRWSRDTFFKYLAPSYEIEHVFHLGTKFSAFADEFQKPRRNLRGRYLLYKLIGFFVILSGRLLERLDGMPSGFAVLAFKR